MRRVVLKQRPKGTRAAPSSQAPCPKLSCPASEFPSTWTCPRCAAAEGLLEAKSPEACVARFPVGPGGRGVCVWARRVPRGLRFSHICPVTSEAWPLISDLPVTVLGPVAWQCFLGGGGADLKDVFLAFPLLCELRIFPSLTFGFF